MHPNLPEYTSIIHGHKAHLQANTTFSQIQFRVTGKVQGVCFRMFTAEKAEGLKLTGHVQNESDGSVGYMHA